MTTLIHIEDDPLWACHVRELLTAWPEFRLLGTAATGASGLAHCRALSPHIVLLDMRLPDQTGAELIDQLGAVRPPPRILLLTSCAGDGVLARSEREPVAGMIWKTMNLNRELREALSAVARGHRHFSPEALQALRRFRAAPGSYVKLLTTRELEALPHFVKGRIDGEVASALGCASATAHAHRKNVMQKLGVHSLAELQDWALRNDVFDIPRPAPPCAASWLDL